MPRTLRQRKNKTDDDSSSASAAPKCKQAKLTPSVGMVENIEPQTIRSKRQSTRPSRHVTKHEADEFVTECGEEQEQSVTLNSKRNRAILSSESDAGDDVLPDTFSPRKKSDKAGTKRLSGNKSTNNVPLIKLDVNQVPVQVLKEEDVKKIFITKEDKESMFEDHSVKDDVKKIKTVKQEKEGRAEDGPSADNEVSDGNESDDPDVLRYAKLREKNLRDNQLFFEKLQIQQAKDTLRLSSEKPKSKPTQRGLQIKKEPKEILPRRTSLRVKRIDPEGKHLPEPEPVPEPEKEMRLPAGPVKLEDCLYSQTDPEVEQRVKKFKTQMMNIKDANKALLKSKGSSSDFAAGLKKMTIYEGGVAKVVPERIFSIAWHPSVSPLLAVAGDKWGHIGVWNVLSDDEEQMVTAFRPHTRPICCVEVPPSAPQKLFSCSYDCTVRCGDFEHGVFDELFTVPADDDDLFRNFNFIDDKANTMLVSHFQGLVSLVDLRTPSTKAEQVFNVSKKSLRTVSVHPTQPEYFITAGTEAKICLWDLRKLSQKSPKPLQCMDQHSKAIASAYFSPTGDKILSSSSDDNILIFSVPPSVSGGQIELSRRIRHNNCTGRWLTNFQPTWHPTVRDTFVVGSMARPREVQVYDAVQGSVMRCLTSEEYLGSVCSLNMFHPHRPHTLVGANSSGRLHVFM